MEQKAMGKQHTGSLRGPKLALLVVGSSLVLADCAGNPSAEQLAVTESTMNNTIGIDNPEYAPVEMKSAQDKLSQAHIAMNDKECDQAKRLTQQAEWDARVAERKTQATEAQKAMEDTRQGVMEPREEGMRDTQH